MRYPFVQTWSRLPHSSCRGITKKDMSEKVKKGACWGEAVGEGTMAPSGT